MGEFPNKETQFKAGVKQVKGLTKVEAGRKGGLVRSPAKKLAATKRLLEQGVCTPKIMEKVHLLIFNPELSYTDWYKNIQWLEDTVGNDHKYQKMIADMKRDWNKAVHGDKSASLVNIQMNNRQNDIMTDEMKDALVKRLLGKKS